MTNEPMNRSHEQFMHRCLALARLGLGRVTPNPLVGAVIVYDGMIIGEGFHQQFGKAHAEVNAINSVEAQYFASLQKSTLYVNLEPCSHFGKTPPCADLIIQHKIPRVIIGCADTSAKVNGQGINKLREAGIEVIVNVLEKECKDINKYFFTYHEKQRPYIILKWAQTADGFMGGVGEKWISNETSRMLVHKWRSEVQSIMVGTNTALLDNPRLDVRDWKGNNPVRIVLDKNLRLPNDLHVFDKMIPTLVFTAKKKSSEPNLEFLTIDAELFEHSVQQMLYALYLREIQSVLVEGGAKLLTSFIKNNLWDEARLFISDKNSIQGIKAPEITGKIVLQEKIVSDKLRVYRNEV